MTPEERKAIIRQNVENAAHAILDHLDGIEEAVIMTHGSNGNIACLAGTETGASGLMLVAIQKTLDAAPDDQTRADLGISIVQNIMEHIQTGGTENA